ncbi:hypothetical protein PR202_gb12861 [Eleusine coracana subsp. coracana]|uniref:Uncharacterized protein n=1 Tax=Eleusine coracana subsp. coracana TaxID=191504 RepID=A0AAV5ERK3_ELECO|nr:hypothetical protein PR202_gb12861 [Eleusine coracana subsp. coracana]
MVHHQEDQNSGQVNTNPSVTPDDTDNQTSANKLVNKKEASSSSSTSSDDIDDDDFFQIEGPILGSTISFGTKQSPPVQAMSRTSDECPDPKRIPSSVFSRSKSSTPTDWSVTSNESLFSINVGNASFSKDHFFMYGKSGELGNLNDPLAPLPPLPRPSTSSPMKSEIVKTTGLAGAKTKPTATKDGDQDATDENTNYMHSMSHRSDASTSFAFPILAGDTKSSQSLKDDQLELARQSTVQLTEQAYPQIQQDIPKLEHEAPKDESTPAPAQEPAPAPTPASTQQPPAPAKWFPWCSCCPSCC